MAQETTPSVADDQEQQRLHAAAEDCIGAIEGRNPRRAETARLAIASVSINAMRGNGLIDTGAILALLDRTDRWHQVCVDAFRQLRLPLLTSEAVLTELFHLVGDSHHSHCGFRRF